MIVLGYAMEKLNDGESFMAAAFAFWLNSTENVAKKTKKTYGPGAFILHGASSLFACLISPIGSYVFCTILVCFCFWS